MMALMVAGLLAMGDVGSRELIWNDEFDGAKLDLAQWSIVEDCWGGGNRERQCYAASNVAVSEGSLFLAARRERGVGSRFPAGHPRAQETATRNFTSGKITTRGKASFLYGRIEVRARLPQGQGLWPAIWMLPEHDNYGPYPLSGEIDIFEAVNLGATCEGCEDRLHGAVHHGPSLEANLHLGGHTLLHDPDGFHVFALEWTPERLTWLLDEKPYFSTEGGPPFDQRFHLIVNLAVGGTWSESSGAGGVDALVFPTTFEVDYVRVYKHTPVG